MQIAYTMTEGRGDTDLLLYGLASDLIAAGLRPGGVVQTNSECGDDRPCDMDVRVLPDGPDFRISQNLGVGSRGCRLNPDALESAVGHVAARLTEGSDLLIVNKFGKQEADGRGFRPVISEALVLGLPVLVGLNALNKPAFETFSGGLAVFVPPEPEALKAWVHGALRAGADSAA